MAEGKRRRLWIMRHGEAEQGAVDARRRLSDRGQQEVARMAAWFVETYFGQETPDQGHLRILASPYHRARQTAERMAAALDTQPEILDTITPEDAVEPVIDWLMAQPAQDMLLVSHMPLVGELAGRLVEGDRRARIAFPTAAIAALDAEVWAAGCGDLRGFYTPDTLPQGVAL